MTNPERFAGLHEVADVLVRELAARFDVVVSAVDPAVATEGVEVGAERAVRLEPADVVGAPAGAVVSVVWTRFPGVHLRAGRRFAEPFPTCGCDACDEDPADVAGELRRVVGAIVGGGFREWSDGRRTGFELDFGGGERRRGWTLDLASRRVPPFDICWGAWAAAKVA